MSSFVVKTAAVSSMRMNLRFTPSGTDSAKDLTNGLPFALVVTQPTLRGWMRMKTRKTDPNISKRCFWYLIKKYETVINVLKRFGIARDTLYRWKDGDVSPSAFWYKP